MTITIDIKEDRVEEAIKLLQDAGCLDYPAPLSDWDAEEIADILKKEADPILGQSRPWSEVRKKYVGRGL